MPRVSDERLAEYAAGGMVPSQDLALDLRDARAECAKWRECAEALAGALRHNLIGHYYCEDSWYSCPKATDGCSNDGAGDDCNCGAAERLTVANAALARFDAMKKEAGCD